MSDERRFLEQELQDEEARHLYAEELGNSSIALQIKTLRLQRGWTQRELARRAGLKQSQISAMEQVDHDTWTVKTLRKLARAFDLALNVGFESFGWLVEDALTTDRKALERSSFSEDPALGDTDEPSRAAAAGKRARRAPTAAD